MEHKRQGCWLGKDANAAFPDLSSEHQLSRHEGESAEQSHEKISKEYLSAGLLLLNSQRQPQKCPLLKAQKPQSRETDFFFSSDTTEAISAAELDRKMPNKPSCPSFQVKTPHFLPEPSFILSVANKAQNYKH